MSSQRHSPRRSSSYRYPSDLTADQWNLIAPFVMTIPAFRRGGSPRKVNLYDVVNAILYLVRTGCSWRQLPHDFPAWRTVYGYHRKWTLDGTVARIHDALREQVRCQEGRQPDPTAGIIDAQSLRGADTVPTASRGYDAGKKVQGRKRHIVVDTIGLLLAIVVTSADVQDRDGGKTVIASLRAKFSRISRIWADGGYAGQLVLWASTAASLTLEIVKRNADLSGFHVLPRRWVVERTFAWLVKCRRLGWDYERLPETHVVMVQWAMVGLMTRRLAPDKTARRPWSSKRPITSAA
jgi:transposase